MKKPKMRQTRLREVQCPSCRKKIDAASNIGGHRRPEPGDFLVCIYCTRILVLDPLLTPRAPRAGELDLAYLRQPLLRAMIERTQAAARMAMTGTTRQQ